MKSCADINQFSFFLPFRQMMNAIGSEHHYKTNDGGLQQDDN